MTCDHVLCKMDNDISNDPIYWMGAALFSGFLFSTWSWGIVYIIIFLIVYEIGYYIFCNYNSKKYDLMIRIGIIAGAFMGFLLGRAITETDDHEESIRQFKKRWL